MKKHLPRKNTDTNVTRAILLNVNEHFDTAAKDYKIENERFTAILGSLIKVGIIALCSENGNSTADYFVSDIQKYNEWKKSDFYRAIEKYVLPLLPATLGAFGAI